ncbi:MAG: hypothetical protein EXQ94_02095 [Alphaproteobacteria bacterium]|nr:hypothetical protein [Alphaproteobacteria bacterium]
MRSSVAKVGHHLALILPESYCEEAGLSEGSFIDLDVNGDRLTIRPVHYGVGDLIARLKNPELKPTDAASQQAGDVLPAKVSTRRL